MPTEVPSLTFYPRAKVRLSIRFEDFGDRILPKPPKKIPHTMRGASKDPPLKVVRDGDRYVLSSKVGGATTPGGTPQQQTTSSDGYTAAIEVIPHSATWKVQPLTEGDRLTLELRYADFPFDPRAIRSVAVQFYLGTVDAAEFYRGVIGQPRTTDDATTGAGEPLQLIPDSFVDPDGMTRTNMRFEGFVDDIEGDYPDEDCPLVRFECSDNMRILVDQVAPPGLAVSPKKPIDQAIAEYMAEFPQFRGLSVEFRPAGQTIPMLSKIVSKVAKQPAIGPVPGKGGDSSLKVWDYFTDVARACGMSIRIEGTTVVIQDPYTLYSNQYTVRVDDPYRPRRLRSGLLLPHRTLVYGRNLTTFNIKRTYTKKVPENIEVRSYNAARKTTLVERYPVKGDRILRAPPGNNTDEKWKVVQIGSWIKDAKVLKQIARTYYESQARNEIQIRASTINMSSYGGNGMDPDLLDMKHGDPVDVGIDGDPIYAVGNVEKCTIEDCVAFTKSLGIPDKVAKAYAKSINNVGLPKTFRLRSMQVDWSCDEGVTLDFEMVNYVEVRADPYMKAGSNTEKALPIEKPPPPGVSARAVQVEDE